MNNVLSIHNCYGCGVCAASCSKKIIKIRLNRDGFYEPYIEHLENAQIVDFVLMFVLTITKNDLFKT